MRYGEVMRPGTTPRWRALRGFMQATRAARALPNFLLIGAPQCGTTSFFAYLIAHPGVIPALVKETQFFRRYYEHGIPWYRSHYPLRFGVAARRRRLGYEPAVGEGTAGCLSNPPTPARVHALNPDMRLIALLRDPVDRTYAHYQKRRQRHGETAAFEDAIANEEERIAGAVRGKTDDLVHMFMSARRNAYMGRSRYAEQLARWLELFPREQLLVLTTEDLARDPAAVIGETVRFLGLPDFSQPASYPRKNTRTYDAMSAAMRAQLAEYFEAPNQRLYDLLGRDLGWARPERASGSLSVPDA